MRPPRAVVLALLALTGCRGEPVASASSDGGTSDARPNDASTPVDGGCASLPGELLRDPSFELWAGATSVAWGGDVTQRTDAAHCSYAATIVSKQYAGTSQQVPINPPLPKGTVLHLRVRAKYISGAGAAPGILLYLRYVGVAQDVSVVRGLTQYPLDGSWGDNTATVVLEQPTEYVAFWLLSGIPEPQTFAVDGASMTAELPDAGS